MRRYEKDIFLNIENKDKVEDYYKKWKEQGEQLLTRIVDLEKVTTLEKDKETVKTIKTEFGHYAAGFEKVYAMVTSGELKTPQDGNKAIAEYKDEVHRLEAAAKELVDITKKRMDGKGKMMADLDRHISIIVMISIAVGLIICLLTSVVITRSVTQPLGGEPAYAAAIVREISKGNLTVAIQLKKNDDSSLLAAIRNTMGKSPRHGGQDPRHLLPGGLAAQRNIHQLRPT